MTAWKKIGLPLIVGLSLGSVSASAQAADYDVGSEQPQYQERYGYEGRHGYRDEFRQGPFVDRSYHHRAYPEWRGAWGRPVARPWWRHADDCRLIIKRRVNPWGEVTTRRIEVCD